MSEIYYEIMVQKKTPSIFKVSRLVSLILMIAFLIPALLGIILAFIPVLICGISFYFLNMYQSVEYEYLYVDKELQIDRILGKTKRKRMETLDINALELMAPENSPELTKMTNGNSMGNKVKKDYSSGIKKDNNYIMVIEGKQIVFEPTQELVKAIKMIAPRKVF